jgi:hypothetical protein
MSSLELLQKRFLFKLLIIRRPYNSERGAQTRGPMAYPATKIEIHKAARVSEVLPKSARTDRKAGANMTPDKVLKLEHRHRTYETMAIAVRINPIKPFCRLGQFRGFCGSCSSSHEIGFNWSASRRSGSLSPLDMINNFR